MGLKYFTHAIYYQFFYFTGITALCFNSHLSMLEVLFHLSLHLIMTCVSVYEATYIWWALHDNGCSIDIPC